MSILFLQHKIKMSCWGLYNLYASLGQIRGGTPSDPLRIMQNVKKLIVIQRNRSRVCDTDECSLLCWRLLTVWVEGTRRARFLCTDWSRMVEWKLAWKHGRWSTLWFCFSQYVNVKYKKLNSFVKTFSLDFNLNFVYFNKVKKYNLLHFLLFWWYLN